MDLETVSPAPESVDDNEGIASPLRKLSENGDNHGDDDPKYGGSNGVHAEEKGDNLDLSLEFGAGVNSPAAVAGMSSPGSPSRARISSPGSPSRTGMSSPGSPSSKGKGLRKWRRIKRGVVKEGGGDNVDGSMLMKRGFPSSGQNTNKPRHLSSGMRQNSEGSVSSTNAVMMSAGNGVDHFAAVDDSRADSENSEDRSSKSSTAASRPVRGYGIEKNRNRNNVSGKNSSVQQGQTGGKGQTSETSKKLRGNAVKIEKENSQSSMESDSRSNNFLFMQGLDSATSNRRQGGRSLILEGESYSEEPQVGSSEKNVAFEDNYQEDSAADADSSWRNKEGESENNDSSRDEDPLLESISSLQSVKEALEKEIQKFMEIGKEDCFHDDTNQVDFGDQSFDSLEPEIILEQNESSKAEIDEANDAYLELEDIIRQKIEAEVEYIAISGKMQNLKVSLTDQITVMEERKTEQTQILNKLEDSEAKAVKLREEARKLENYCEEIVNAEEASQLKSRVCKYTKCFIIQLILLAATIAFLLFSQLLPKPPKVVPT